VTAVGPIEEAVAAARRGDLIVLPTDTVYGIASRPDDPRATAAIFAAKDRPADLTLPVLVATADAAREIAVFDDRAERLASGAWPGPLTIVLPRRDASATWALGGAGGTIGVRVPAHPLARFLLARTGPLAVTSANRSGERPSRTCEELVRTFGDAVAVYLCQDDPLAGAASTVVDLAHGEPRLLRLGDVDENTVARFLSGQGPLLDSGPS
jgi:L-threonylcarbamoyladenylate synthase